MSKTILLIESDQPFARELSSALEASGFGVRVSGDGKEGLDLARDLRPDLVVLCVELPRMSGYSVCNKLKKDDELREIPLLVISAEATPETFEQHRKLKTRAEDYLIKPFPPAALLERVAALIGMPEGAGASEEEVVTLADVELEAAGANDIPPLEFSSARGTEEDEDLRLLDDAFDTIARGAAEPAAAHAPPAPIEPERLEPVHAEPAHLEHAEREHLEPADLHLAAEAEGQPLAFVTEEAHLEPAPPEPGEPHLHPAPSAATAHGRDDGAFAPPPAPGLEHPGPSEPPLASTEDLLRAAGIPLLDAEPPAGAAFASDGLRTELEDARRVLADRDAEARGLREELLRLRAAAEQEALDTGTLESELRAARARIDAVQGTVKKLEADLYAAREEARHATERAASMEKDLGALRTRLEESERLSSQRGAEVAEAVARAESAGRTLEELRTELSVSRNESSAVRGEAERRSADLRRRVQDLEAQAARHEERVVKAYQKIKSDEKLKEKTRKALTVALQLLDERLPPEGAAEAPPAPAPEQPAS